LKIKICVDIDLKEIVPLFLENRQQDIRLLESALDAQDLDTIRRLGHTMKGAGASYGFPAISDMGRAIEAAAISGALPAIVKKKEELAQFLAQVEIEFVRK